MICTLLGLAVATAVYFFSPPPYQSEAMLFIRYVMENSTPGVPGGDSKAVSPDQRGETIINSEVAILGSQDIAEQVATVVGPDKILGKTKGPKDQVHAAASISKDLIIDPVPRSSVIRIVYRNHDPTVVQPVLTEIVEAYLKKHVEVHHGSLNAGDFLSQETDQLRSRLTQTEDELRKAKDQAGIVSIEDSKRDYTEQVARIKQDIYNAEAELADRSATLEDLYKRSPEKAKAAGAVTDAKQPATPSATVDEYRGIVARLDLLRRTEQQLLGEFTEQSQRVKDVRSQIADVTAQKQKLEANFPELGRIVVVAPPISGPNSTPAPGDTIDMVAEAARLNGLQSRIKVLNSELEQVRKEEGVVDQLEGTISDLQRQKELEETNYKYYATHLEAERIDETLGAGHALNIAEIQKPSPPEIDSLKQFKLLGGIAGGGLALGVAWAFLIELYLDRSIRRAKDIEKVLNIPLFLSIPDFGRNGHNKNVFHETLRDRLIGYFESKNLTHKPKLLAVTGVGRNSGVTTTAAGLAKCLSETGEGNVLLVDMTQNQGSAQQFNNGKAVCGFDQLLDTRNNALVQDKFYVVGEEPNSERLTRALPSRFSQLVPQLKASDFDYIIFDMPPVSQISITPRLAGFMDMVLLVVESEHTDKEIARQAAELLGASRAHVGIVLNKTRNYLPSKLHHDFLGTG